MRGANNCAILPPPPDNCAADTQTWGGGCSAASPNTSHQGSVALVNTNPAFVGNANYTCNDGNMVLGSQSCVPAGPSNCPARTLSWGSGCSDFTPSTNHGENTDILTSGNVNTLRIGAAVFACNDGNYSFLSGNCDPRPAKCGNGTVHETRLCEIYADFYNRFPESGAFNFWTNPANEFVRITEQSPTIAQTCQRAFIAAGTNSAQGGTADCLRFVENKGYKPLEAQGNSCKPGYYLQNQIGGAYRGQVSPFDVDQTNYCRDLID